MADKMKKLYLEWNDRLATHCSLTRGEFPAMVPSRVDKAEEELLREIVKRLGARLDKNIGNPAALGSHREFFWAQIEIRALVQKYRRIGALCGGTLVDRYRAEYETARETTRKYAEEVTALRPEKVDPVLAYRIA